MKKILFLMKYPICLKENLKKKFDGQMNACVRLGYEVWYIEWDGEYFYIVCKNTKKKEKIFPCKTVISIEKYYHSLYFIDLYRAGCRILKKKQFDYIYMRFMVFFSPVVKMVTRRGKNTKLIMEIPSYPFEDEYRKEKRFLRKLGFKLSNHYRKKVFSEVDLFTLCGKPSNGFAYGKPALNIINGIDVDNIPLRKPRLDEKEVHILLLASMCNWHAYDRMIEALKTYQSDKIIRFHFVGEDGDGSLKEWKRMVEEYGLTEKILFHGALYGAQLDEMIDTSDIGIGTLGLYRNNASNGATLKAREYMSRGLPFVFAGYDQAIGEDFPYVMRVSNDDTPLVMEKVIEFAIKFKNCEAIPSYMREYAREHMSWDGEFRKIFSGLKGERGSDKKE